MEVVAKTLEQIIIFSNNVDTIFVLFENEMDKNFPIKNPSIKTTVAYNKLLQKPSWIEHTASPYLLSCKEHYVLYTTEMATEKH